MGGEIFPWKAGNEGAREQGSVRCAVALSQREGARGLGSEGLGTSAGMMDERIPPETVICRDEAQNSCACVGRRLVMRQEAMWFGSRLLFCRR